MGARATRADVADWAGRLDVQPPRLGRRMERFSGGNQQKAVLARWLRTDPRLLLLDEPTQGVDVGAKATIYRHVAEAAERGMGVLVTSSDAEELARLCHRVLVLRAGTVAAELSGPDLTEERLVAETFGATSHRKASRVVHHRITTRVVRDDADMLDPLEPEADGTSAAPGTPAAAAGAARPWWQRLRDRLRGVR